MTLRLGMCTANSRDTGAVIRTARRVQFIPILLTAFGIGTGLVAGQATVSPSQVVDVRGLVRARTQRQDFRIFGIAQCNGRWAALARFETTKNSLIVLGGTGSAPRLSGFVDGLADRIALDTSGQIYLRMPASPAGRMIEILDPSLSFIGAQRLKDSGFEPIPSALGVFWSKGPINGIFTVGLGIVRQVTTFAGKTDAPFDSRTPDYGTMMAWTDGKAAPRWVRVKEVAEEVTVFDTSGALLTRATMDLDSAYAALGYQQPQRYPAVEAVRVGWTVMSRNGELYVRLGSLRIDRPTPLAVIDPLTGRLLRVVSIVVPTSAERVGTYNPQGFMHAGTGAMDDQLVVPDLDLGLLAFYSL